MSEAPRTAPRAVLFDLDDTLYDHRHAIRAALREVARQAPALLRHGEAALQSRYARALEAMHPRVLAGELGYEAARVERYRQLLAWVGADAGAAAGLARLQAAAYRRHERLVPGARAVLDALRERGLPLAIVSNSTRPEQAGKLERLGISGHFRALVVAADHGIAKPDARLFRIAADALGVAPSQALFIGDRWEIDVAGARAAGMRAAWLRPAQAAGAAGEAGRDEPDVAVLDGWSLPAVQRLLGCAMPARAAGDA